MKERDASRAILEYLQLMRPGCFWRQQSMSAVTIDKAGKRHYMRAGRKGVGDITGIARDGRRVEIEVKSDTGKQSPEQKEFQALIESMGGIYRLAKTIDDIRDLA